MNSVISAGLDSHPQPPKSHQRDTDPQDTTAAGGFAAVLAAGTRGGSEPSRETPKPSEAAAKAPARQSSGTNDAPGRGPDEPAAARPRPEGSPQIDQNQTNRNGPTEPTRSVGLQVAQQVHSDAAAGAATTVKAPTPGTAGEITPPPPKYLPNMQLPDQGTAGEITPLPPDRVPFQPELHLWSVQIEVTPAASGSEPTPTDAAPQQPVNMVHANNLAFQVADSVIRVLKVLEDARRQGSAPASSGPANTTGTATPPPTGPSTPLAAEATAKTTAEGPEPTEHFSRPGPRPVNVQQLTAHLRLDPPELGVLRVQLEIRGDTLTAHLHASNALAHQALSEKLPQLRQVLEHAGIQVDRLEVSNRTTAHQSDRPDQPPQRRWAGEQSGGQGQGRRSDQSFGRQEAPNEDHETVENPFQAEAWGGEEADQ